MEKSLLVEAASIVYQAVTAEVREESLVDEILSNIIWLTALDDCSEIRHAISGSSKIHSRDHAQRLLASINEHSSTRRNRGVYYTPQDVVDFVIVNSVAAYYRIPVGTTAQYVLPHDVPTEDFAYRLRVFDPTSGLSEFLISALRLKICRLLESGVQPNEIAIDKLVQTIHGNDIDPDSIAISRIRLYLEISTLLGNHHANAAVPSLLHVFTSIDFIATKIDNEAKFELIVGNPPYVEDRQYGGVLDDRYGNVYCNVLSNASKLLTPDGAIGFIVPLSYSSTPRMRRIRTELLSRLSQQVVMSFADRPDSLFSKVHQKLCILIATNEPNCAFYTSNYQYWYKDERTRLFKNIALTLNQFASEDKIPKLGTSQDISLFSKFENLQTPTVYEISRSGSHIVCINRRETFWMKAFRGSRHHPEFKEFYFDSRDDAALLYCILNSSLFWWYWIAVSDCWHVSRSLNSFKMPNSYDSSDFGSLAARLESRLELTKKRVNTKQTEFEYKHVESLDVIEEIDHAVNQIYGLTPSESEYVRNFAIEYRTGRKVTPNVQGY